MVQREAIYCALGRCTHRLRDQVNFELWLPILAREAREPNPMYRLIKRRIAWLIGKWYFHAKPTSSVNRQIWEVLLYLLSDRSDGSDPAVRLTAVFAVSECADVRRSVALRVTMLIFSFPTHRTTTSFWRTSCPTWHSTLPLSSFRSTNQRPTRVKIASSKV